MWENDVKKLSIQSICWGVNEHETFQECGIDDTYEGEEGEDGEEEEVGEEEYE